MIILNRAYAASEDVLAVSAVLEASEIYDPDARVYQYRYRADLGEYWYYEDFDMSVQDIGYFTDENSKTDYFVLLSAEGDVHHFADPERFRERIVGAGTTADDSKAYGKTLKIKQIGPHLYACGAGGQVYKRLGQNDWQILDGSLLYDRSAEDRNLKEEEPKAMTPEWFQWIKQKSLNPVSRDVIFYGVAGLSENDLYLCGVERKKPILCYWDGSTLHELKVHLPEAALTGIHVENADSVWVGGREGVLLHGSYARGFSPVTLRQQLNLFHMITPYRGKLVLPASVRPGGLFEYDPETGNFSRFDPPLPRLSSKSNPDFVESGPFFAQAVGDVLWVVASKDIFRFDGKEWERIDHPDL